MSDKLDELKETVEYLQNQAANYNVEVIHHIGEQPELPLDPPPVDPPPVDPPPVDPPSPPQDDTFMVEVTCGLTDKDWALCYFQKGENQNGHPIMEIYPGANSSSSERIKVPKGTGVLCSDKIIADGKDRYGDRNKFWVMAGPGSTEKGHQLYLHAKDAVKDEG